jgi:hypothetical protein
LPIITASPIASAGRFSPRGPLGIFGFHPFDEVSPIHANTIFAGCSALAPDQSFFGDVAVAFEGAIIAVDLKLDTIIFDVHIHREIFDRYFHAVTSMLSAKHIGGWDGWR